MIDHPTIRDRELGMDGVSQRQAVNWTMAPGDPMFADNLEHYAGVGESALRCIAASRLLAAVGQPRSVLDFACANGRVTRWLKAAFPDADLHVADINTGWANWSAKTFGATAWTSTEDLAEAQAPRLYDIIWCGSLATHVSPAQTSALLHKFHDWLEPNGIAVVTMHGRRFVRNAIAGTHSYFPDAKSIQPLLAGMAATGFGYVPHPGASHGISAATPTWLIQNIMAMGARVVTFSEHAWDGHQDVVTFQKAQM